MKIGSVPVGRAARPFVIAEMSGNHNQSLDRALELTVADGDFQEQFHRFLSTPEVAAFFHELSAHVNDLPTSAEETAAMPLAAPMLHWERRQVG